MGNSEKNNRIYSNLVNKLDDISSGNSAEGIESIFSRNFINFNGGYKANKDIMPNSDFGKKVVEDMQRYSELCGRRKKVEIEGGERIIAGEDESLESLYISYDLISKVVLPFFSQKNQFSDRLFNEIHNLSLSYIDAIVDATADEYINLDSVMESKIDSTELAKKGSLIYESYLYNGLNEKTKTLLSGFKSKLNATKKDFMRPYQTVATTRKKVYRKMPLTSKIIEEILEKDSDNFKFKPDFILPIAHGGTELGIDIANAYENKGVFMPVYPLMYSIKTRKQKYPWIHYDEQFFKEGFEGKKFLITEDWVTTGNTLRGILNEVEKHFPNEVRVATIKRDKEKSLVPILDKYEFYIGDWVLYKGSKTDSLFDMNR